MPPGKSALGDLRSHAGRSVKCRNPATPRAQPFGQRPLRNEFHFQFALQILTLEFAIFADVGTRRSLDAFCVEQHAEAPTVDAAVIGNGHEIRGALLQQRLYQVKRNAVEAKSADRNRSAARYVFHCLGACGDYFIHPLAT